jgi:type IV pilus assembly protein PilA
MFQRFHAMKEEREGGFTLIELLVVILIIAILAAIAIPVFLNQRKKGWTSQAQSALKNMATAEETYLVDQGVYSNTLAGLTSNGFRYSTADVTPTVVGPTGTANALRYCLKVVSVHDTSIVWYYDSDVGAPSTTACTAFA